MRADIRELTARLRDAGRVAVLTGAGVSAASGVPTFRGAGGLWRQFRAEDLATPQAFARDPRLVWEWYGWRREAIAACQPNAAHIVLARWTTRNAEWRVITQNVDDLHVRAGTRGLIRLHGSIWELSCCSRCPDSPPRWRDERVPLPEPLPSCPHCRELARPAVVWFGESLAPSDTRDAEAATACMCSSQREHPPWYIRRPDSLDSARARGVHGRGEPRSDTRILECRRRDSRQPKRCWRKLTRRSKSDGPPGP